MSITKERIKEIYETNYSVEPSVSETDDLCKLALRGLAADRLAETMENFNHHPLCRDALAEYRKEVAGE